MHVKAGAQDILHIHAISAQVMTDTLTNSGWCIVFQTRKYAPHYLVPSPRKDPGRRKKHILINNNILFFIHLTIRLFYNYLQPIRLAGADFSERKLMLVGWLGLICSERKILLTDS
jgi:hypothetical protein